MKAGHPRASSVPLVVCLLLVGVFGIAVGLGQHLGMPMPSWPQVGPDRETGMRPSQPTRISIPTLGVRANVVEVGRADDGSIAAPVEDPVRTAGWYGLGPTPGEPGTAVIVGHVDTASRPAVFRRLGEIEAGKIIEVIRKDRKVATFTVESVETFPKTSFPADRVFAESDTPRLVLVTCGGTWLGGPIGYADNVIVFARLA
jgi:hypothetical protein